MASRTFCGFELPPTSRKLAGPPPECLMMSMVAMARPAPLTMQPISPSRLTKLRPASFASSFLGGILLRVPQLRDFRVPEEPVVVEDDLASAATSWPWVVTKGLISTSEQSFSRKSPYMVPR